MKNIRMVIVTFLFLLVFQSEAFATTYNISKPQQIYTYEQLTEDILKLANDYPDLIKYESLGKTKYGRDIWAIKMGYGDATLLITAATHAREWITTNVTMYQIINYAKSYDNNEVFHHQNVRDILDKTTIWFVPMVNPDGVTLQQKGLSAFPEEDHQNLINMNEGSNDFTRWKANAEGIDPNRNFDIDFDLIDGPKSPTWRNYKGDYPNQIIETRSIYDLNLRIEPEMLIAYHTAGEVLYWDYKSPPLKEFNYSIAKEIANITGYTIIYNSNKPAGSHMDWFVKKYNRPGFTPELGVFPGQTNVPVTAFNKMWDENKVLTLYGAKKSYELWLDRQKEEALNINIQLLASTKLYSSPMITSGASINPQIMSVIAEKGDWWKIKTWLGPMWIPKANTKEIIPYGFVDFKEHEYWSEPMLWGINKGLFVGISKKNRSYLLPNEILTEAQFLTVLLRLGQEYEMKTMEPSKKHWSSVTYQLAGNYPLPIKGSIENLVAGDVPITRGEMAEILYAYHQNTKDFLLKDAVQFMYDNELASGYDSKNLTVETFGINDYLLRGQIAKILRQYEMKFLNN